MWADFSQHFAIGTFLLLVGELLAVATIINVVIKARSAAGAWGWSMAVIALPFVAVPVYWILGRNQFKGYMDLLRDAQESNEHIFSDLSTALSPFRAELDEEQQHYAGVLERLSQRHFTKDNEICLLINGVQTFEAIFEEIESAKEYVLAQFFIVKNDNLGNRFRELLERKSKEGVRVYFVYDEIGSHSLPGRYVRSLRKAGVKIFDYHATQGPTNRYQVNFRNHRKIVVVDGRVGFVGGHNVGDEYLGKTERYGEWRDTHVRMAGPSVLTLQLVFLADYYWAAREIPELNWASVVPADGEGCGGGPSTILTLPTGPVDKIEGCTVFFLNAITRARRRIWIATPYFVTDESVRSSLQMAALRGVDVRIMIPDKPDKYIPWLATFCYLEDMEAAGVRIFRYSPGFLHQKVVLVDEEFSAVGTANLDNRSMRLNFEVTAVVLCEDFARQVESMLEVDFARCREVGGADFSSRNWWFRLGAKLARLFSPIL